MCIDTNLVLKHKNLHSIIYISVVINYEYSVANP